MFAGHEPPLSGTGTRRDPRAVTHTGIGDERIIRAVARAHDLTLIVMQRNPRLDVVAGDADAAIADALIDGNSPRRRQDPWDDVLADPVRIGAADRVRDLSRDGNHHKLVMVDAGRLIATFCR